MPGPSTLKLLYLWRVRVGPAEVKVTSAMLRFFFFFLLKKFASWETFPFGDLYSRSRLWTQRHPFQFGHTALRFTVTPLSLRPLTLARSYLLRLV
jgi:hypothetical protein